MNRNKARSSLKKVTLLENEETDPAKSIKRRISFSGKKFIREFNATEIPRDYNNSYEISEHNNDSSGQAHASAAEMDKENTPLVSVPDTSAYDGTDFIFQMQTSINLTLLPHELNAHNQIMEPVGPIDITSRCSLSVSDVACAKIRENSRYNVPVTEKTMDLMSTEMNFSDIEPENISIEKDEEPIVKQTNSCKTRQEHVKEKLYFNDDISCDFDNIEPSAIVTTKSDHCKEPMVIGEGDYMSFLQDDSTISSPLIPLDIISENGKSKKLNFRQLNEALNSGRIQLFPNGPKTPTTDRKAKQQRYWDGSEQLPMEEGVTLKNTIKPRGTLNFNESMLVSPISQPPKASTMNEKSDINPGDMKRNYRFSQADELMLDNTNFLVHAKVGDETQSRSNSKCSSRRETTYDNTAMEWEDLEKREAAVAAALKQVNCGQTIHNVEAIDEDEYLTVAKNQKCATLSNDVENQSVKNWHLNESIERAKPETNIIEAMNLTQAELNSSDNYEEQRQMEGSEQSGFPNREQRCKLQTRTTNLEKQYIKTLHCTEKDNITKAQREPNPQTSATAEIQKSQTFFLCDSIEEESFEIRSVPTVAPKLLHNSQKRELDSYEPASRNKSESQPHYSRRRQTRHMSDPIDEDFACNQEQHHPPTCGSLAANVSAANKKPMNMHRQTLLTPQLIEEDIVSFKTDTSISNSDNCRRRQTMHMSDPIDEDLTCNQEELHPPTYGSSTLHRNKKRTTLLMSKEIEEDVSAANKDFKTTQKSMNMHRQTYTPQLIEKDVGSVKTETSIANPDYCKRRQTMHMSDPIDEDLTCNQEELQPPTFGSLASQRHKKRTTLLMSEEIEEDLSAANKDFKGTKKSMNVHRQTLYTPQLIEKDVESVKTETSIPNSDNCRQRPTLHRSDPIEEDIACSQEEVHPPTFGPLASHRYNKRGTFLMSEPIENDVLDPNQDIRVAKTSNCKSTQSLSTPIHNKKTKYVDEPICSRPLTKEQNRNHLQSLIMSESIQENTGSIEFKTQSSVTQHLKKANRQTLHLVEAIDEEIASFPLTPNSPSSNKMNENAVQDSLCEELAQMRTKTRLTNAASASIIMETSDDEQIRDKNQSTDKAEYSSPCRRTSKTVESKTQTILETPKNNKSQSLKQNYFPITPGVSMIEYEEEEERCEVKSATPTSARTICQSLAMDISCYDTPVAVSKQANSFNVKRLPIHLTPNLPHSKKRNVQPSVTREIEDLQTIQLNIGGPKPDMSRLDTTAGNRSRIPIKTKSFIQNSPTEQLDGTVQIVRSQLMRQPLDQFNVEVGSPDEDNIKKGFALYEANPITISDVSNHFLAQRNLAKQSLANSTEMPRDTSFDSRSSNEHTKGNIKKFINLSGDTEIFAAAEISYEDEIEKIKQSLVSNLFDEDDYEIDFQDCEAPIENHLDTSLKQLSSPVAKAADASEKFTQSKLSIDSSNATLSAFAIPDWNQLQQDLERLQRVRKRPHIKDVERYWQLKKTQLELMVTNNETADDSRETENDSNESELLTVPQMLEMLNNKINEYTASLAKPSPTKTFVKRLKVLLLAELPNWIFDYQLKCENTFIFTHRKISTFQIIVIYETVDCLETEIRVQRIKADTMPTIPKAQWTVHEHLMDFQLRLKLPLNIIDLLEGNDVESFFKFLKHMDNLCMETVRQCTKVHLTLMSSESRLLREPNRNVVRKIIHKIYQVEDELYTRLERVQFLINIGNIEEISFKDILQPPLYMFDEKIQFLPKGIDFLDVFLKNPEQYLRINN